jgi:hypothetical protein
MNDHNRPCQYTQTNFIHEPVTGMNELKEVVNLTVKICLSENQVGI